MRQFDVFVSPSKETEPPFTDKDLGWFFCENINEFLEQSEAEWVIFSTPEININREFLNSLAECIAGFPMVDAFAPRIRTVDGEFYNGLKLDKKMGFSEIANDADLRFVAAPHFSIAAFSRRIIQRTGHLDNTLPKELRLADFSLRMLHAGGKMFHVPYLVTSANASIDSADTICKDLKATAKVLYKSLGIVHATKFAVHHPTVLPTLAILDKELKYKRDKATDLSKLKQNVLQEISK